MGSKDYNLIVQNFFLKTCVVFFLFLGTSDLVIAAGGKYKGNYSGTFSSENTNDEGIWIALICSSGNVHFLIGSNITGKVGATKDIEISKDGYFEGETNINSYSITANITSENVVEGDWQLGDLSKGKLEGQLNSSRKVNNYSGSYIDHDARKMRIDVASNGYIGGSNSFIFLESLEGAVDGSGNMILYTYKRSFNVYISGYIGEIRDNGDFEVYRKSGDVWVSGYKPHAKFDDDDDVCFISTAIK